MGIKLTTTKKAGVENGIKILVHAPAGTGKTRLCATTPDPSKTVIISAEAGLLSLRGVDIPVIEVSTIDDVKDAYRFIMNDEQAKDFEWVCLDSVTEIAEVCLATAMKEASDPRQAYGHMMSEMNEIIRVFRDMPGKNIYMSCKQERVRDEQEGHMLYGPSMPGSKLGPGLPYLFDEVFALRVYKDAETGEVSRALQTVNDAQYAAKDRSGALEAFEPADLGAIAEKIKFGEKKKTKKVDSGKAAA